MNQASTGRRSGTTSVLPAGLALALVTGAGFAAETEQRVVLEEVAVTGTSIKGVAAVGAPAQSVGSEDLQVSGISNTNDALKQLPQFVNLGADEGRGGGVQGAVSNITQAHTVNLRGLGPGATLVLLDGRRMVVNGTQGQFYDLSAIPTNAIGRIEVVTDGASAIYGSEAVAGVVNLITRRDFRGADTALRYESGDGFDRQRFQQNLGLGWDRGSLFVAFEHFEQSGLLGSDRDEVTQDLRPWGGPDLRANFASPGTIVVGTTTYAIPTGQDGRSLTAADFVAGTDNRLDVNESRTLLGDQIRDSVALSLNFDVSDTLALWYAGYYNDRRYRGEGYSLNNGAAVGTLRVPNTNPFFVHPSSTTATSVSVNYSYMNDFRAVARGGETGYQNAVGFDWDFGDDWSLAAYFTHNYNEGHRHVDGQVRTAYLTQALADPNPATAFNPFCDGNVFQCNNPETLARIRGWSFIGSKIRLHDAVVRLNGRLFDLPGGAVRMALGGEYADWKAFFRNGRNVVTPVGEPDPVLVPSIVTRDVKSAFGEVLLPLFGPDNARTGLQRLDFSLAARYEEYSDFGGTTNPKYGVTWVPTPGLSLRASYGSSFRAPTLFDIDPNVTTGPSAYNVTDPQTSQQVRAIVLNGPRPGLGPETSTMFTAGFDWQPQALPGLETSLTYYRINYINQMLALPATVLLQNEALFPDLVIRDPSLDLVLQLLAHPYWSGGSQEVPENIKYVIDIRRANLGGWWQRGIDASVSYSWENSLGNWYAGVGGNVILHSERSDAPGLPRNDVLDTIFNSVTPRVRGHLGWNRNGWRADAFVNFIGGYRNTLLQPSVGVNSWTTLDLSASWSGGEAGPAWSRGLEVAVNINNATDEDPPLVLITDAGSQGAYDPTSASVIGRVLTLEIRKRW